MKEPVSRTRTVLRVVTRVCLVIIPAAGLMMSQPHPAAAGAGEEKVTICHRPPGNPENEHTIVVGEPAVPAHLAHGDDLGECGGPPPS
jgi:hypothetical protein